MSYYPPEDRGTSPLLLWVSMSLALYLAGICLFALLTAHILTP